MGSRLSPAARSLIRRHVHSVGELDLLVLLHAERDRTWSEEEICVALGCPPSWAAAQLKRMERAGFVRHDGDRWRFAAATPELEKATEEVGDAYRRHRRDVVRFVFATPSGKDKRLQRRPA